MKPYHFIVGAVALGLASCAAYFSIIGIATFFGTNFTQTAIAAGFLEAGKLVCASAAYRYRNVVKGWTNTLLVFFTVVMMFVTSLGIFGFLSQSYQEASAQRQISEQKVENVRSQKRALEDKIERLQTDRDRIIETRNNLRSLQQEQGWLSERDAERLQQIPEDLKNISSQISEARDEALKLEKKITSLEAQNSESAKLGPIMFVADSVGLDPDRAALYFILTIIFVFDPMAVTLVVSLSMATEIDEVEDSSSDEDDGWDYFDNMEKRLGHESAAEIDTEDDEIKEGERVMRGYDPAGKKVGDLSDALKKISEPLPDDYQSHLEDNENPGIEELYDNEEEKEFRRNVDEFVEEEGDDFEEWLGEREEGETEDEKDTLDLPEVESAFRKPYRNISQSG